MDVGRVVDDEGAVPHHREVDREVADVAALVVVLRREEGKQTIKRLGKCLFTTDSILFAWRCSHKSTFTQTDTFHKYTITGGLQSQSSGGVNEDGRREGRRGGKKTIERVRMGESGGGWMERSE